MLNALQLRVRKLAGDQQQLDDAWFSIWRAQELSRLDEQGTVYADFTGAALYPESLVRRDALRLTRSVLGNPHSEHRASLASSRDLECARASILKFLRASPDEYAVILTANASASCRLVGESFPFATASQLLLTADNHNSVNGIREFASRRGADIRSIDLDEELRLRDASKCLINKPTELPSLFAFPAQSNFSGVRHPLALVDEAQSRGWRVLLDAASYLSTADLHLDEVKPDFVVLSLYKIIGYPTGIGALVARHDALRELQRPWFAGGAVRWVSTSRNTHLLAEGVTAFEDGTPSFIAAGIVPDALDAADASDRRALSRHSAALTRYTLNHLRTLRHSNSEPLIAIHGPMDMESRGATIACTLHNDQGLPIPYWLVEADARLAGIALRGGCFCNPGCAESVFDLSSARAVACLADLGGDFTVQKFSERMGNAPVGAIRISYGLGSVFADADRIVEFLKSYVVE